MPLFYHKTGRTLKPETIERKRIFKECCPSEVRTYLESHEFNGLADNSKESYLRSLEYLVEFWATHYKKKLTQNLMTSKPFISKFAKYLMDKGISEHSVRYHFMVIQCFMIYRRWDKKYFKYSPSNEARLAKRKKKQEMFLTETEVRMCLRYDGWKHNEIRNRLIVRILTETGIRISELVRIKRKDCILSERRIIIYPKKTVGRSVYIGEYTYDVLKIYLNITRGIDDPEALLFRLNEHQVKYALNYMIIELGIKKPGRRCHIFRHFCASNMVFNKGIPMIEASQLLGNSTHTLENNYLYPTEKSRAEIRKKLFQGHEL
jgi:integrase/recombinase XerD